MTEQRLREILKSLRDEKLRIEELIADFQMFGAESTLHKNRANKGRPVSNKKPGKRVLRAEPRAY